MDVVEFEKESEKNKEIGLVERIIKNELSASNAHNMMKTILRERVEKKLEKKRTLKPVQSDDFTIYNKSIKSNLFHAHIESNPATCLNNLLHCHTTNNRTIISQCRFNTTLCC